MGFLSELDNDFIRDLLERSGSLISETPLGGTLSPEIECPEANKTYIFTEAQTKSGLLGLRPGLQRPGRLL